METLRLGNGRYVVARRASEGFLGLLLLGKSPILRLPFRPRFRLLAGFILWRYIITKEPAGKCLSECKLKDGYVVECLVLRVGASLCEFGFVFGSGAADGPVARKKIKAQVGLRL